MDNELELLHKKLDEVNANLTKIHQEHFWWANELAQRQILIEKFFGITDASLPFEPYYLRGHDISPAYPEIYNKYGERMEVFFMSDREGAHVPNSPGSRYIYWDRYNYGLETHFYTHDEIFRTVGKPKRKFAAMIEPPSIKPQSYENVLKNKDYVEKNFDAIFTYDARILTTLKNAIFVPFGLSVWYGKNVEGMMSDGAAAGFSNDGKPKKSAVNPAENYKHKTKNISIIASAKKTCPMHLIRQKFAFKCKELPNVDTYGKFDGGGTYRLSCPLKNTAIQSPLKI